VVATQDGFVDVGTTSTVTATAATGYLFDHWEQDGVTVGGSSPTFNVLMNDSHGLKAFFVKNEWTVLMYVAGGNELAPQALATLKQMESVDLRNSSITILALVDRAAAWDSSWSGTRLYKVKFDTSGQGLPSSELLTSTELGLTSQPANLDMGDPNTLKNFVRAARNNYPATHYGIVFWGHGTGWRAANAGVTRAVGVDDDSHDVLYTSEIGQGLSAITEGAPNQKFGFVGMDLCFGSMVETLYEIRNYADYFVGSEGLVPTNGWRYDLALPAFRDLAAKSPQASAKTFFDAFVTGYSSLNNVEISQVDLSKVEPLVQQWNTWSTTATAGITTSTIRSSVRTKLFLNATSFYTTPGDLNLDLGDVAVKVKGEIGVDNTGVAQALGTAVVQNFSTRQASDGGLAPTSGIAIHFVPLDANGYYQLPFDDAYIRGSGSVNAPAFVADSTWVPSVAGTGFLDVIWNKVF
jgi:hypothetical protein